MSAPVAPSAPQPPPRDLVPGTVHDLAPEGDCDGIELGDLDLSGRQADRVRLIDSRLVGCRLDDVSLRRARLTSSAWEHVAATSLDATSSTWLDVDLTGCRLGALVLAGAELTRVRVTGGKVDYLNLRDAVLADVHLVEAARARPERARVVTSGW